MSPTTPPPDDPSQPDEPPPPWVTSDDDPAMLDWFGEPLDRPRPVVTCPRCDERFDDQVAFTIHIGAEHPELSRPPKRRSPSPRWLDPRAGPPAALGRNQRTPLAVKLQGIPLVLVVAINVVLVVVVFALLDLHGPGWWAEIPWQRRRLLGIAVMWPTAIFLMLRGID